MNELKLERILLLMLMITAGFAFITGCDLYEDEDGDWDNKVTIRIVNSSDCLVDLTVDGTEQGELEPDEEFEETDYGRGIHLLEAYPWNDEQFSCEEFYTPELEPGDTYEWEITNEGGCSQCDPTPTPVPDTPTPTVTPAT